MIRAALAAAVLAAAAAKAGAQGSPWSTTGIVSPEPVRGCARMVAMDADSLWMAVDTPEGRAPTLWHYSATDGYWGAYEFNIPEEFLYALADLILEPAAGGSPKLILGLHVTEDPRMGPLRTSFFRIDPADVTIEDLPDCRLSSMPAVANLSTTLVSVSGTLYAMMIDMMTYESRLCGLPPGGSSWTVYAAPPRIVSSGGLMMAALGASIYALPTTRDGQATVPPPELWRYDIAANAWRSSAVAADGLVAPPVGLHYHSAFTVDGDGGLVLFPGYDAMRPGSLRTFYRYRPGAPSWSRIVDAPEDWGLGSCLTQVPGGPLLMLRANPVESFPLLAYDQIEPLLPSAPVQHAVGGPDLPAGGEVLIAAGASSVAMEVAARLDDPNGDLVQIEVEIKPAGVAFPVAPASSELQSGPLSNAGAIAICRLSALGIGRYHWRARSVDDTGRRSDWIVFGGDPGTGDFVVRPLVPPSAFDPVQGAGPGFASLVPGARVAERTRVRFEVATTAVAGDSVILDVEARAAGESFRGIATASSAWSQAGSRVGVDLSPAAGGWSWRYRLRDLLDVVTPWTAFGPEDGSADFTVVAGGSYGGSLGCSGSAAGEGPTLLAAALILAIFLLECGPIAKGEICNPCPR